MNILFDIGHPAHVHLFRNVYKALQGKGHMFYITVKDIPAAKKLLEIYEMPYIDLGTKKDSKISKGFKQLNYDWKMFHLVKKFNIELGLGSSITIPHVSKLTGMRSLVFDDDDDAVEPLFVRFGHAFADHIFTPDVIHRKSHKSIYYPGTHELAYLHPNQFTPDPSVLSENNLTPDDTYFILRFNAFKAHHDREGDGLLPDQKSRLIEKLARYGKVFITTEREIEPELREFQLSISPEKIHSFLYYATAFIGDSQTMTSEAAILGTPAFKCNAFAGRLSVPNDLEQNYQLCYAYLPAAFDKMTTDLQHLLKQVGLKSTWRERVHKLLKEKIDVTAFFIWFLENYPESLSMMHNNPEVMKQFFA